VDRADETNPPRRTGIAYFVVFTAAGTLLLLLCIEAVAAILLRSPIGAGPAFFEEARRRYHLHHERDIVQFQPACAEFDLELGYRLRPGTCRFTTRVFDTELSINSLGVRDSESALVAPSIVIAGDSYAMGWGVEHDETVSHQLSLLTGEKTLNLGVSSYGTAREMSMLGRADLSGAEALVIQYCENDFAENVAFAQGNGRLRTMSRAAYAERVEEHLATTRYAMGKHVRRFVPILWKGLRGFPEPGVARPCAQDARAFLNTLHLTSAPPRPLRVIVFEGLYGPEHRTCFLDALAAQARAGGLPTWISQLDTIDVASILSDADYLPLDGHLNAQGHRKVAEAVAEVLSGTN